jgi:hypothetical protein
MRAIAVAAAFCFAAACGTDPAVAPPTESFTPVDVGGPSFASASCVQRDTVSSWMKRLLSCGQRVRVTSGDPTLASKIPAAINIWNSAVLGHDGLPEFVTAAPWTRTVTVQFGRSYYGSTWYCGDTDGSGLTISIHRSGTKADCGQPSTYTNATTIDGLQRLIAHELSHTIAIKHLSSLNASSAVNHCVASLPANGDANGRVCQAEIQILRYTYGIRDTDVVDLSKHFATGFEVSAPASLKVGEPGTLTVDAVEFDRAAPSFTPPSASTLNYTWTVDNPAVATLGSGTSSTKTVQAVGAGTTTIHVKLSSTTYEKAVPFTGGDITLTVVAPPTQPPPPTGLTASAVTFSSATIGWVNGATDAGTTTTLEYRKSGDATWTTASSTIPAGATTFGLSGLAPVSTYDVRASHVRSGLSSTITTAAGLFSTPAVPPLPPITNYHVASCEMRPVGAKTYNYFALAWTANTAPAGSTLQIGEYTTSNPASAAVILTLPLTARTAEVGGYLNNPTLNNRWLWIRYVGNGVTGPWTGLVENPLAANQCLQ